MKKIILALLVILDLFPLMACTDSAVDPADSVLRLDTYAADVSYEGSGSGFVAFDTFYVVDME